MVLCYARSRQQIRTPAMYQARVLMEYTPRLIKSLLHRYLSSSSYPFGGAISLVAVTCHHAGANTSTPPGNPLVEGAEADVREGAPRREDDITSHPDHLLLTAAPSKRQKEEGRRRRGQKLVARGKYHYNLSLPLHLPR